MESFDFIESGIIFGLDSFENLKKFKHPTKDFAKHGDAYQFLLKYVDDYGEIPSADHVAENYPTLDPSATTLNLDYAMNKFKDQVLYRQIVNVFNTNKDILKESPKKAFSQITHSLNDISLVYDEEVVTYNNGHSLDRLSEWEERTVKRQMGDGLMGIKTPFKTLNNLGVGWLPGELISLFARPTVGKTWMSVLVAAIAAMAGHKTLLVSTEMPVSAINLRADVVMGNLMGYKLSHKALRNGDPIDTEVYKQFLETLTNENSPSLLVCDHINGEGTMTIEGIAGLVRKHAPDFVVLDGIYLVTSGLTTTKAMWEQSHALFYAMKGLCLSQNVAMFVTTQANRDAANVYVPPQPETVAFGDALLRASDVTLSMARVENDTLKRVVQYQKYRDGEIAIDMSLLEWDVDRGYIEEIGSKFFEANEY
jgi:replicative DNA helicase